MENRAVIAMAANRRIVQEGLDRRKQESQLNAFEDEMLRRINENCENAAWQTRQDIYDRINREGCKSRIAARAEAAAKTKQRRKDTALGILTLFAHAVVMLWLTTWTYFPIYAAVTLIVGGAMFLALYLCRVHGLL